MAVILKSDGVTVVGAADAFDHDDWACSTPESHSTAAAWKDRTGGIADCQWRRTTLDNGPGARPTRRAVRFAEATLLAQEAPLGACNFRWHSLPGRGFEKLEQVEPAGKADFRWRRRRVQSQPSHCAAVGRSVDSMTAKPSIAPAALSSSASAASSAIVRIAPAANRQGHAECRGPTCVGQRTPTRRSLDTCPHGRMARAGDRVSACAASPRPHAAEEQSRCGRSGAPAWVRTRALAMSR